jgi:hypothetical protein
MPPPSRIALCMLLLTGATALRAQQPRSADLALTYISQRSLRANSGQNFWMEGGSAELGFNLWRGWGPAADFTGSYTSSIGSSGVPLVLTTATFGPRYRWHAAKRVSAYGQALFGVASGSNSVFPTPSGTESSARSFALQLSGGMDCRLSEHIAVRVIDLGYLHTALSNGNNNVQNILRLGTGAVFRF